MKSSVSPINCQFWFIYLEVLFLGAYKFMTVTYSWWKDPSVEDYLVWNRHSHVSFILCYSLHGIWYLFLHSFIFQLTWITLCNVPFIQLTFTRVLLFNQSDNHCLSTRMFRPNKILLTSLHLNLPSCNFFSIFSKLFSPYCFFLDYFGLIKYVLYLILFPIMTLTICIFTN